MKKKNYGGRKARQKRRENLFFGVMIGVLILMAVLTVVYVMTDDDATTYTVTADGHVHTADGLHVGMIDDLLGEDGSELVVTEDGHVHTANGDHLGMVDGTAAEGEAQTDEAAADPE